MLSAPFCKMDVAKPHRRRTNSETSATEYNKLDMKPRRRRTSSERSNTVCELHCLLANHTYLYILFFNHALLVTNSYI